jgi:hypothetical protein
VNREISMLTLDGIGLKFGRTRKEMGLPPQLGPAANERKPVVRSLLALQEFYAHLILVSLILVGIWLLEKLLKWLWGAGKIFRCMTAK